MRVLITGVTGFVGSRLARALIDRGDEVYGLVRRRADLSPPKRLVEQGVIDQVKIINGDLTDLTSLISAVHQSEPDIVFHLGSQSYVPRSFTDPLETFRVNSQGTQNLLEAIRLKAANPKIIFAGSSEEYGLQIAHEKHLELSQVDARYVFPEPERVPELPINEKNFLRPLSPYAVSKITGDHLMRNYHSVYGLRTVVSRGFNHEGAGRGDHFVTSVITRQGVALTHGEQDQINIGNVNAFRDWSHVEDIVAGYILLAERGRDGDVYVQGSKRTNSVLTYLLWTLEVLGYEINTLETGTKLKYGEPTEPAPDPWYGIDFEKTKMDNLLLGGRLGFTPADKGLVLKTNKEDVKINIDPARFRPADVPVLFSDTTKIEKIGFEIKHSVKDIIWEQVNYYLNPENRKPQK